MNSSTAEERRTQRFAEKVETKFLCANSASSAYSAVNEFWLSIEQRYSQSFNARPMPKVVWSQL